MSSAGIRLLSSIIGDGSSQKLIKLNLYPELFKGSESDLYDFLMEHTAKFGAVPTEETVTEEIGNVLVPAKEPSAYYLEQVEKRRLQDRLRGAVQESAELLKSKNPEEAFKILADEMAELHKVRNRNNLTDFRNAGALVKKEYLHVKGVSDSGLKFGWPKLDTDTGGVGAGDFISFVGRPTAGKTFMLLAAAKYHWENEGLPLVVSMEMNTTVITQRLAAMHSHKNLTQLMRAMMSTPMYTSLNADLKQMRKKEKPFWIVDGQMATTVDDIVLLCRQLNPSAVFVDGAYLLRHENNRLSRFDRITENAEGLKQRVATDMGIPVVASYQLNREAGKKDKGKGGTGGGTEKKATMDDIYGSDAMAQLSTIVLGLLQHDGVETKTKRRVEILKGRNGGAGAFYINWDFHNLDFSQVPEEESTANMKFM